MKGKPEAIVMPLQQTPLFKAVAAGNPDFLAVKDYARRMAEIKHASGDAEEPAEGCAVGSEEGG